LAAKEKLAGKEVKQAFRRATGKNRLVRAVSVSVIVFVIATLQYEGRFFLWEALTLLPFNLVLAIDLGMSLAP